MTGLGLNDDLAEVVATISGLGLVLTELHLAQPASPFCGLARDLFLEALEHAGYRQDDRRGRRCGQDRLKRDIPPLRLAAAAIISSNLRINKISSAFHRTTAHFIPAGRMNPRTVDRANR